MAFSLAYFELTLDFMLVFHSKLCQTDSNMYLPGVVAKGHLSTLKIWGGFICRSINSALEEAAI